MNLLKRKRRKLHGFLFMIVLFCMNMGIAQSNKTILSSQPSNLRKWLTQKTWDELFPNRHGYLPKQRKNKNDFYSFKAFLEAADLFPLFLSEEDTVLQKRELCAFLANMAYETGGGWAEAPGGYYKWGLFYIEEKGCEKGCPQYADPNKPNYPLADSQSYHGRGGLQISWNYNYGQFSETYFGNKEILLKNPGLVSEDAKLAFASAIWFWITPQYPKPSCHDIISNTWSPSIKDIAGGRAPGFGSVVNVINGGIECGKEPLAGTKFRYGFYEFFCKYFQVSAGDHAECSSQKPFGQ